MKPASEIKRNLLKMSLESAKEGDHLGKEHYLSLYFAVKDDSMVYERKKNYNLKNRD